MLPQALRIVDGSHREQCSVTHHPAGVKMSCPHLPPVPGAGDDVSSEARLRLGIGFLVYGMGGTFNACFVPSQHLSLFCPLPR